MSEDPRPQAPERPLPGDCCGGGCVPCVMDAWEDAMEGHCLRLAEWLARHPPRHGPEADDRARGRAPERLVLDTNVSLDLFVFADVRWDPLRMALEQGRSEAVVDAPCREEFIRVLAYGQLALSPCERVRAIEAFDALCRYLDVEDGSGARKSDALPRCADPDDQKFLELALRSRADAVLSKDKAVLKLAKRLRRLEWFGVLHPGDWVAAHAPEREAPVRDA